MKELFKKLIASFDNHSKGFSSRKLSAFIGVLVAIYITQKHVESSNLEVILVTWLGFSLLCLGIVTAEQIITFKNGKKDEQ